MKPASPELPRAVQPAPSARPERAGRRGALRILCGGGGALLLLVSAGCMMGPDYKRPDLNVPDGYRDAPPATPATGNTTAAAAPAGNAQAASVADLSWWQLYQDPVLQQLLQEALKNNYDVQIAAQRVIQAKQLQLQQASYLYPQLNYSGGAARGRNQFNGNFQPLNGATQSTGLVQFGASWELDLWGRLRRLDQVARDQYLATEQAQRGVWLSLVSEVAATYFELLAFDAQLRVAQRATATYTETLKLFEDRLAGGVASLLDTSSAAGALGAAAADIPDYQRQIELTENRLSVLLGRNPGAITRGENLFVQAFAPQIPVGLPSQLLERRPDVRQSELLLMAASAQIGAAKANFFPQLSLTGALGRVSNDLSSFNSLGNAWSIAAAFSGPIFQGGLLRAQYKQALSAFQEARLSYENTVLNAFADVSDALINREKYALVRVQQEYSVRSYAEAVDVSMKRYIAGKASYYEVLDAQTKLFPNESRLVETRVNELLAVVDLYLALGGGWNLQGEDFLNGPPPPLAAPPMPDSGTPGTPGAAAPATPPTGQPATATPPAAGAGATTPPATTTPPPTAPAATPPVATTAPVAPPATTPAAASPASPTTSPGATPPGASPTTAPRATPPPMRYPYNAAEDEVLQSARAVGANPVADPLLPPAAPPPVNGSSNAPPTPPTATP